MSKPRLALGFTPVLLLTLLFSGMLSAQRREDILSIQRDVAQLQDQVTQLRNEQSQKLISLEGLLKQALEENTRLAASVTALERTITERMNQQQARIEAPVANLGSKVDGVSEDVRAVRENVAGLSARVSTLDNKLSDISSAIRTLNTPPTPPPGSGASSVPGAPTAPAGVSADSLWQNANRDRSGGKSELALNEFNDFVKYFPQSENAPAAQYYIGDIYYNNKQYTDAAQSFDAVLERFQENPKTADALYMKGASLMNAQRRTEAVAEFKDFLSRYPNHSLAAKAQAHLRTLGASTVPRATKKQSP